MTSITLTETAALLVRASWQAALVAALIVAMQWILRKRLSPGMRYALWFVLLARLSMPYLPQSPASMFNLARVGPFNGAVKVEPVEMAVTPPPTALHASSQPLPESHVVTPDGPFNARLPRISSGSAAADLTTIIPAPALLAKDSAPAVPSGSPANPLWPLGLAWAWLAGAGCLAMRLAWQNVAFATRLRGACRLTGRRLSETLNDCARSLGVRKLPPVLETNAVQSPALYGLWRPRLLLPSGLAQGLSAAELRFVFLHELAHLKRRDLIVNWMVALLGVVHWFNPVLWFAFGRMRADRELACDALALSCAGEGENLAYGQTLLKILAGVSRRSAAAGLVGIAEDMRQMKARMTMIRQFRSKSAAKTLPVLASLALAAAALTDAQVASPVQSDPASVAKPAEDAATARSANPSADRNDPNTSLVQDARLLIESGNLDEAEAKLLQVVRDRPDDRTAHYYLSLIKEARFQPKKKPAEVTFPGGRRSNPGSDIIRRKLQNITFNQVMYQDLPLSEVVRDLVDQSRRRDPDQVGINIILSPGAAAVDPTADSQTGQSKPATSLNDIPVRLSLKQVRLVDLLDAICEVAESPIQYKVEEYAVVFSHRMPEIPRLYTRTYRVDPNSFLEGLDAVARVLEQRHAPSREQPEVTPDGLGQSLRDIPNGKVGIASGNITNRAVIERIRNFFAAAGVDFSKDPISVGAAGVPQPSGKALFFNDRTGLLLARATMEELDIIEKAIHVLNIAPPQVAISARLIELTARDENKQLGFDWYIGQIHAGSVVSGEGAAQGGAPGVSGGVFPNGGANSSTTAAPGVARNPGLSGVLTDAQTRVVLRALEQRDGAKTLATPTVTTLSGRQIRTEVPSLGFSLDVAPHVKADGFTIELNVDFKLDRPAASGAPGASKPLRISTNALVWDGQTLLLGPLPASSDEASATRVLLLITPTLVDPAGNRVHSGDEQPYRPK